MVANHYTKRLGLSATCLTQIAAKAAPRAVTGTTGPTAAGSTNPGSGTPTFTRDMATDTKATPKPSASASPTARGDLAATGSGETVGWTAAAGVTAVAGGLLSLRRRNRGRHGAS
ncbi:LPXTG cell wall anchor domain-containing protein [Streptomyces sp. NPDC101152]|uniref:LPXTG cell wall anchor domain-containing protein n=1 Tax=Streptomyces sp. NPDC101152 TaxID=3366116 RepID=UPI0038038C23